MPLPGEQTLYQWVKHLILRIDGYQQLILSLHSSSTINFWHKIVSFRLNQPQYTSALPLDIILVLSTLCIRRRRYASLNRKHWARHFRRRYWVATSKGILSKYKNTESRLLKKQFRSLRFKQCWWDSSILELSPQELEYAREFLGMNKGEWQTFLRSISLQEWRMLHQAWSSWTSWERSLS